MNLLKAIFTPQNLIAWFVINLCVIGFLSAWVFVNVKVLGNDVEISTVENQIRRMK